MYLRLVDFCNVGYPSETNLKLQISNAHNLLLIYTIVLDNFTEHGSITAEGGREIWV